MMRNMPLLSVLVLSLLLALPLISAPDPGRPDPEPQGHSAKHSETPYLGVWVLAVDAARAKDLNLKTDRGLLITKITEKSPAQKAGLRESDVVLEFEGHRVEDSEDLKDRIRASTPGRKVQLVINRAGTERTVTVTMGSSSGKTGVASAAEVETQLAAIRRRAAAQPVPQPLLSWNAPSLGLEAEELNGQMARFFGVEQGVLVRVVLPESPAEHAGFQAGDVITGVNASGVSSPEAVVRELSRLQGKARNDVEMRVVRNRNPLRLRVDLTWDPAAGLPQVHSVNRK